MKYFWDSIVVEFLEDRSPVEVVPRMCGNLPLSITGHAATWLESDRPEASAYHLKFSEDTRSCPAIEYINDKWHYLMWDHARYYTTPHSRIAAPLNFGLGTCYASSIEVSLLSTESVNDESMRDDSHTDKSAPTSVQSPLVNEEFQERPRKAFAFGFDANMLPIEMATTTLQETTINHGLAQGEDIDMYCAQVYPGAGGDPGGEGGHGFETGGGGPPTGNSGQSYL